MLVEVVEKSREVDVAAMRAARKQSGEEVEAVDSGETAAAEAEPAAE